MTSSSWTFVRALQAERLDPDRDSRMILVRAQAVSYVWGRQDAGEGERDTSASIAFGDAYGLHALDYEVGRIGSRRTLQDAYASWVETGDVAP